MLGAEFDRRVCCCGHSCRVRLPFYMAAVAQLGRSFILLEKKKRKIE